MQPTPPVFRGPPAAGGIVYLPTACRNAIWAIPLIQPANGAHQAGAARQLRRPSSRIAFSLRIIGRTSGFMVSFSKSAIQRSGVMAG
jgi:hypothetical protein